MSNTVILIQIFNSILFGIGSNWWLYNRRHARKVPQVAIFWTIYFGIILVLNFGFSALEANSVNIQYDYTPTEETVNTLD